MEDLSPKTVIITLNINSLTLYDFISVKFLK